MTDLTNLKQTLILQEIQSRCCLVQLTEKDTAGLNTHYSRREILEIIVLPKSLRNDEAETRMCQICQSLGCNVNKKHLVACFWLKDTERVIVTFCQRKDYEKVLKAKNDLRELNTTNLDLREGSEIFANQNLCSYYHSF